MFRELICNPILSLSVFLVCRLISASQHDSGSEVTKGTQDRMNLIKMVQASIPMFENKTLTIAVVVREPFVIFSLPDEYARKNQFPVEQKRTSSPSASSEPKLKLAMEDLNNYSGIAIEVVRWLSFVFKFKVKVVRTRDNQFGIMKPNGNWTGLVGSLVRKESDLGVSALSITAKRAEVIDFTQAYYVETASMVLPIPEQVQNFFVIFEPFSPSVWVALTGAVICLIALITIMTRLEDSQRERHKLHRMAKLLAERRDVAPGLSSLSDHLEIVRFTRLFERQLAAINRAKRGSQFGSNWTERFYYSTACVLNILLNKDIKHPPHQTPIRILVCFWWLATIVIVNIYLGTLFEQLVLPLPARSIESLEELVQQERVRWCVTSGSAIEELFRTAEQRSIYGQLGVRMAQVSNVDEGIERVLTSGWAFIREHSMLTFKLEQEHRRLGACRMQLAKEHFFSVGLGLALAKGSIYVKPFNAALTLMIENGFIARWRSQYWPQKSQYTECQSLQSLGKSEPLSLRHFLSIYLVCGCIFIFALLALLYQNGVQVLTWHRKSSATGGSHADVPQK